MKFYIISWIISFAFVKIQIILHSLVQIQKFSAEFWVSFKYRKFQSHNSKAMAKDKEVNITLTNLKARVIFPLLVIFGQIKYLWVNSSVFFDEFRHHRPYHKILD